MELANQDGLADLRLYIVAKNPAIFPQEPHFQPIQGGAADTPRRISGAVPDDTGDNISHLNAYYAEISSMYWVWKNAKPARRVGFFHYRRFLNFGEPLCPDQPWYVRNFFDFEPTTLQRFGWTAGQSLAALEGCDLALPQKEQVTRPPTWQYECSIYTQYCESHIPRDIALAMQVIAEIHPNDVALARRVMHDDHAYFCHLYVMEWNLFQAYMDWLIPILETIRSRIDLSSSLYHPSTGQTRALGFIGERLFNIFIERSRVQGTKIREFERLFGIFEPPQQPAALDTAPF